MIGRLRGTIWQCEPGRVHLDVGGVGYELQIPLSTYYRIAEGGNGEVELLVHTHVREDAITLFGFATPGERDMFLHLTSISGVGPRIALAALSGIGPDELRQAVNERDNGRIQRVPGIGKKTAARIVLELRDRLEREPAPGPSPGARPAAGAERSLRSDAASALANLGYSDDVSFRAVDRVLKEAGEDVPDLQDLLRRSLRDLTR